MNIQKPRNGNYVFTIKAKDNLNNAKNYQIFIEDINLFDDIDNNIENLTVKENNITNVSEAKKEIGFMEKEDYVE